MSPLNELNLNDVFIINNYIFQKILVSIIEVPVRDKEWQFLSIILYKKRVFLLFEIAKMH